MILILLWSSQSLNALERISKIVNEQIEQVLTECFALKPVQKPASSSDYSNDCHWSSW